MVMTAMDIIYQLKYSEFPDSYKNVRGLIVSS